MLIPSIDLQNGHVVQLVQGERLAIEAPDPEPWIQRFSRFARVQLIDLDAARGRGDNAAMVASVCQRLPCRVGGGIRSVARAQEVLAAGAHAVIASSALFRDGAVDVAFARTLSEVPMYRKVIDSFGLSNNSQGDLGWLHAILVFGELYDDSADVLTNPASEVIRKLESVAGVNPHAVQRIKALLAKLELQYAGGQRQ